MRKDIKKSSVFWALLLLQICLSNNSATSCIIKEREALLRFKESYRRPTTKLASWNSNISDCCFWSGIGCDRTTGHVTKIDLRSNVIDHSRPYSPGLNSLLELKYLNYLDLSVHDFEFTQIPNFFGSLRELRYLNLSRSRFSGIIPPQLGNLTQLVTLDLSYNQFSNERRLIMDDDIEWISHIPSLHYLNLNGVDFKKTSNVIKILTSLPLLSSLILSNCNLQNTHFYLDSFNSSFLTRIQLLDLSSNNFRGPFLETFLNMSSLRFLHVSNNLFINDPIPASLEKLSSLEILDLSKNDLTGAIPTSFRRLWNLRELYLQGNKLKEVEDECFDQLQNLEVLDVSNNVLEGVLTEAAFANMSKLHTLKFGYNIEHHFLLDMKSNWVPPFQLRYVHGGSCMGCFGSEFPQWLQTQKELIELLLFNMNISSNLPTWLMGQNLTTLHLANNKIKGSIFPIIANHMPNLSRLFMSHNLINDSLQSLPFKLKNLEFLDLSHNLIQSPLAINLSHQLPNLRVLILSNNLINGSLPQSVCKWKDMEILDLSNNKLSGMIEGCLLTSKLIFLDLSSNKFSGTFPCSNGSDLSNIIYLLLNKNKFEGSLPIVLKSSKRLNILDLQGNNFFGNIPTWVGQSFPILVVLKLGGNLFNGSIPSSLFNLTQLQILDLSNNQLHGSIPPNLHNLLAMTTNEGFGVLTIDIEVDYFNGLQKMILQSIKSNYFNYSLSRMRLAVIDLSVNYLTGFIPSEITMLKELIGLNLSHNNLTGIIPKQIGDIEALESLDFSHNQLCGSIPDSISKLDALGKLELSNNNLSGKIPREGHLSTFNEVSSFDNNRYLCGDPLPKCWSSKTPSELQFENEDEADDKWEKWILYITIILGYVIGFWAVVGSLITKRSWRNAYFNFVDDIKYKFLAAVC